MVSNVGFKVGQQRIILCNQDAEILTIIDSLKIKATHLIVV